MKALSIKQPWASLIVYGYKNYEFRSWKTKYHGPIYIHASATIDKEAMKVFQNYPIPFPTGCLLATAVIEDCLEVTTELEKTLIQKDPTVYGYTQGRARYAWELCAITRLEHPISMKGKLGLWNLDEMVLK